VIKKSSSLTYLVLGLSVTLLSSLSQAQAGYFIEKIDIPGTLTKTSTSFINNNGQIIVTNADDSEAGHTHYLITENETTLFSNMRVEDFNDKAEVVGSCGTGGVCIWDQANGFTALEGVQHTNDFLTPTYARAINNNGQVIYDDVKLRVRGINSNLMTYSKFIGKRYQ